MDEKLKIIRELKLKLIENFGDNIVNVILFGSQITGKANEFSDYDILIVLKNEYDWKLRNEIYAVCYDIELDYDIIFDTTLISLNELNNTLRGKQPFICSALNNGIAA